MPDFRHLLTAKANSFTKPKPWPAGTYFGVVKAREFREFSPPDSPNEKIPSLRLAVVATGAGEDIDQAVLTDALQGKPINARQLQKNFSLDEASEYRLWEFAETCGIDLAAMSKAEAIELIPGKQVIFTLTAKPSADGTQIYNNITEIRGA